MVVAVISPNTEAQDGIAKALEGTVEAVWSLLAYPQPDQLKELPQQQDGCIVFLDFSEFHRASAIAAAAQTSFTSIRIVAMLAGRGAPPAELARLGIRDVTGLPPTVNEVLQILAKMNPEPEPSSDSHDGGGRIFAFLPAKPGAGATTLAVHTAAAVARLSGERTLLADFDFRLGMTSFLLKLPGEHSVIDALSDRADLDNRWGNLVNRRGMLDVLGSAPQEFLDPDPERGTALLLAFARKRYPHVIVDLPGEMRDYELDTLRRATGCFLVCTADIGVMHMAQRKANHLRTLGLDAKTSVIMNRVGGLRMMSSSDVESIVQLPLRFSVANAEKEIAEAIRSAAAIEGRGGVAAQIENIARGMLPGKETIPAETPTRKLLDLFAGGGSRSRAGGR